MGELWPIQCGGQRGWTGRWRGTMVNRESARELFLEQEKGLNVAPGITGSRLDPGGRCFSVCSSRWGAGPSVPPGAGALSAPSPGPRTTSPRLFLCVFVDSHVCLFVFFFFLELLNLEFSMDVNLRLSPAWPFPSFQLERSIQLLVYPSTHSFCSFFFPLDLGFEFRTSYSRGRSPATVLHPNIVINNYY